VGRLAQREKRIALSLPLEVRGEDETGGTFTEVTRSLNISGGGICFESHRHLAVGARLVLSIEVPTSLRRHFGNRDVYHARAVVCRVERLAGREVARVGARLLGEAPPEEV
jgi:hypothetical protein